MKKTTLFYFLLAICSNVTAQNVGIGIALPQAKLHIGNSIHGLRIEGPTSQGSGGSALHIGGLGDIIVDAPGIVGGRFVILENGNIGIGTVIPRAKLHVADGSVLFEGSSTLYENAPEPPASGDGARMMWYSARAAFRVGVVTGSEWDKNNIGGWSFAAGYNTKASNSFSTAIGARSISSGNASIALGESASSTQDFAIAIGRFATASNYSAVSIGEKNTAEGAFSLAMGIVSIASAQSSTSIGNNTIAKAVGGTTFGMYNDNQDNPDKNSPNPADRMFQIGNGTEGNRKNALTILRNGNFGIGQLSPLSAKLVISGLPSQEGLDLASYDQYANLRVLRNSLNGIDHDMFIGLGSGEVSALHLYSNNAETVTIKDNKVGIGTNNPTSKLQVDGAIRVQGRQTTHAQGASLEWNNLEGSGATYLLNQKGLGGGGFVFGEVDNANIIIHRLNIDNNGNAGINNAAPASTLDVNGAIATKSNYYGTGSGTITLNNSATVWIIATSGYSVTLPDPAACANRRYTIVNKTGSPISISNFYNMGSVLANTIPSFSSIEVISSITTNRWEQIK